MPGAYRMDFASQLSSAAARCVLFVCLVAAAIIGQPVSARGAEVPKDPRKVEGADAKTQAEMKPYTDVIANAEVTFDMVPIPGGKFVMGSPDGEPGHKSDEAPQHEVEIAPFWMGKCEVTWNEYEVWMFALDIQRRQVNNVDATDLEKQADAVTRPTKPYTDMTFGMGKDGYPAISHDAVGRQDVLQVAEPEDRPLLSPADRGRVGIRLPGRHHDGLQFRRRSGQARRLCLVRRKQQRQVSQGRQEKAQSLGAVRHARQRRPNGRSISTFPRAIKSSPARLSVNPLVIPKTLYPQAVRGGAWTDDPERAAQCRPTGIAQGLEAAGSATSAEHLVFHRRAVPRLSRGPPAGRADGRGESQDLGRRCGISN